MKKRIGVIMYQTSTGRRDRSSSPNEWLDISRNLGNEAYLITSVYHDGKETVSERQMGEKGYFLINDVELDIPVIRRQPCNKWPRAELASKT